MNFNKAQLGAIEHKDGAMLVLAGPGSGKTAVITHRTKNLITKHHVKPSEILVITFTKAAANEMKERFNSLMKDERVNVFLRYSNMHIALQVPILLMSLLDTALSGKFYPTTASNTKMRMSL